MLTPVLLCGGVGSRLWPLSRELYPKQFLPLVTERSMLVDTLQRASALEGVGSAVVLCNEDHRFIVAEQLRSDGIEAAAIVLEPEGRNTAPAVAVAALLALENDPDAVLLVLPADHAISALDAFTEAVRTGLPHALNGAMVTFGVVPRSPETGYGYIKRSTESVGGCHVIEQFVEKPNVTTAERYLAEGDYLWNSGMFLLGARGYLDELDKHAPQILTAVNKALEAGSRDLEFLRLGREEFCRCPGNSVDYAVMENTDRGMVVPLNCGWSDVGAWTSLWEIGERDDEGNVSVGDTFLDSTRNSYVRAGSRLVSTSGVEDLVIVETADAVLVASKDRVQNVKDIVARLKALGRNEVTAHTQVFRPWGSYESIAAGHRFQVKRIIVNPGQKLSLQMHHHRAEHWIVVSGTAAVTCDDQEFMLSEDQSTYIPIGKNHRLANPGVIPLEIIEVQSGSYLGEDDIVRFDDMYGRET